MMRLLRRLRARVRYRNFDADLQREIAEHRAMKQAALAAEGGGPAEARARAARILGNVTLAREQARGVWIAPWLESVWQDVRYAARSLRSSPAFTLPALAALVITMGLTTSLYATIESILLRPWSVPDTDRVVKVVTTQHTPGGTFYRTGLVQYRYFRDHARAVDLAAMTSMDLPLGAGEDQGSTVRLVSGSYFSVLRTTITAGRALGPADDTTTDSAVAVISHGLWQRSFGGRPDAIGATVLIGRVPFTVVGIAAAGATDSPLARVPDAWIPIHARTRLPGIEPSPRALLEDPGGCCLEIFGRLVNGASRRSADSEIKLLASQFAGLHGIPPLETSVTSTAFANEPMAARAVQYFALLALGTTLVLLLGCANVANLLLARGLARRRETAVRLAIGATRPRVVRQLLTEALVLSAVAAGGSLLAAQFLPRLILPASVPAVSLSSAVVLFACGLAVAVCLVSSLLPALASTRAGLRTQWIGVSRPRLRSTLLGLQVAISTILLAGTGLLVRGVQHAATSGLGFDPYRVAAVRLVQLPPGYGASEIAQLSGSLADSMAQEGLGPFAGTRGVPFVGGYRASYDVRRPDRDESTKSRAVTHRVTPGYFEVLGIQTVAGRLLDATSGEDDVVVNESLARLLWSGEPAVDRVFLDGTQEKRVIGVVADARTESIGRSSPTYYQKTDAFTAVLIRNDPATIARTRELIRTLAPGASASVVDFAPLLRQELETSIVGAAIAGAIAALALLLAGIGTLGVFSYIVNERTREIGVRMALGARARDVIRLLTARLTRPLVGGLAVGLIGALALGGLLRSYLYGLSPHDPAAYAAVLLVLAVTAIAATFVPLRRALRVDPTVTLRHE